MPPPVGLQHTTRQQSILQKIFHFFQFPKCTLVLCDTGVLGKVLVFVVCRSLPPYHLGLFLQTRTLLSLEHCSSGAAALSTLYFSEKRAMLAEQSPATECNSGGQSSNSATLPQAHASLTAEPLCHKTSAKAWSQVCLETIKYSAISAPLKFLISNRGPT